MRGHNWRWWFHAIHRDVGYLCAGLVLIYAISGIAVNHVADWNPSYSTTRVQSNVGPVPHGEDVDDALAREVLGRLSSSPDYLALFQPGPHELRILRENHSIDVRLDTGEVAQEFVARRPGLYQVNFLHLNHGKELWTWVADGFAVLLIVLAVTGMFLLKGKNGFLGRGLWIAGAGLVVPLFFYWFYA
ncbi:MAG: hypothetical protein FJ265_17495 [Planctomycetes bacterium]|nr:hypothetical protein [Planctomycetota bacterium]